MIKENTSEYRRKMGYSLIHIFQKPERIKKLTLRQWDRFIPQLRKANLQARLYYVLKEKKLLGSVPRKPLMHLISSKKIYRANRRTVCWEAVKIHQVLDNTVVYLKGAAYVLGNIPAGNGRVFNDVDILVSRKLLGDVEKKLLSNGWVFSSRDSYDQKYYRQWMHELPVFKNIRRRTFLDVHHNILPETAGIKIDSGKLIENSMPLNREGSIRILAPEDMILHSATHLFNEGELSNGLRDLIDLDSLIIHFAKEKIFWKKLLNRAKELNLVRPLYYALHYTDRILGTKIPGWVQRDVKKNSPAYAVCLVMDLLYMNAFNPEYQVSEKPSRKLSLWCLYVRSHYIRMPLGLLIPHLLKKFVKKRSGN